MSNKFKEGDLARVMSGEITATGTVTSTQGDYVCVEYRHAHGPITQGYYPASILALVLPETAVEAPEPHAKPRATTKDILAK